MLVTPSRVALKDTVTVPLEGRVSVGAAAVVLLNEPAEAVHVYATVPVAVPPRLAPRETFADGFARVAPVMVALNVREPTVTVWLSEAVCPPRVMVSETIALPLEGSVSVGVADVVLLNEPAVVDHA